MSVKIWDSASRAFVEPQNVPRRYDAESGAFVDTTGKAYDADAWAEKWSQGKVIYDDFVSSDLDTSKWVKITNGTPTFGISNGSLNMAGTNSNTAGISSAYTLTGKEKYVELEYYVSTEGGSYSENKYTFMQDYANDGYGAGGSYGLNANGTSKFEQNFFLISSYPGHNRRLFKYTFPAGSKTYTTTYETTYSITAPYKMKFVYEDGIVTLYVNDDPVTQFPVDMQYIIGQPVFKIMTGNYDGANKSASISLDYIKLTIK